MKRIVPIAISVFIFTYVSGQTNAPTNTQTAKPSKEVTLKYINEKLENFGATYKKKITNWGTTNYEDGSTTEDHTTTLYACTLYEILEEDKDVYLKANWLKHFSSDIAFQKKRDESLNWVSFASFSFVKSIEIYHSRTYRSPGYPIVLEGGSKTDEMVTYENGYLQFNFVSKCVINTLENGEKENVDYFIIAFKEEEDNLLEKVKKAFLNLQAYYPTVYPSKDPFDN